MFSQIVDSGATCHMCKDSKLFDKFETLIEPNTLRDALASPDKQNRSLLWKTLEDNDVWDLVELTKYQNLDGTKLVVKVKTGLMVQ